MSATTTPGQIAITWWQRRSDPRLSTALKTASDLTNWTPLPASASAVVFQDAEWTVQHSLISTPAAARLY